MATKLGIKTRRGQHDITIHDRIETTQPSGEITVTYDTTPYATRRAFVFTKGGREFRQASQLVAELSLLLSIRFVLGDDIKPLMRIKFRGRDLEIVVAENVNELDEEWWLYCREIVV